MKTSITALKRKRRRAARTVPPIEEILRGTVLKRKVRCGKPSCHCAQRGGHPGWYLTVTLAPGKTKQISLPCPLVPTAQRWVANYLKWWEVVEKISALNREWLRREREAKKSL